MVITVVALLDARGVLRGTSAWKPEARRYAGTWRTDPMTDITEQALRGYREQAERTSDEPLSGKATRPGRRPVRTVERIAHELEQLHRHLVA